MRGFYTQIHRKGPWRRDLVAGLLPGRTAEQCREKCMSIWSQKFNQGDWTSTEDACLCTLQRKEPNQWDEFMGWLGGRRANDIRERWLLLESRG
jgi:hypothetical protein